MNPYYRREPTRYEEIAERVRVGKKVSAEDMRFYQERRRHGGEVAAANQGGEDSAGAVLVSVRNHHNGAADPRRHTQLLTDCTEYVSV